MRTANLANEAIRQAEVGHVWKEVISGAQASVEVPKMATFRVRATGASTVTIAGQLAMTMSTGEIAIFCAGSGDPAVTTGTVTVTIGAANAFVQVAQDTPRKV